MCLSVSKLLLKDFLGKPSPWVSYDPASPILLVFTLLVWLTLFFLHWAMKFKSGHLILGSILAGIWQYLSAWPCCLFYCNMEQAVYLSEHSCLVSLFHPDKWTVKISNSCHTPGFLNSPKLQFLSSTSSLITLHYRHFTQKSDFKW